MKPQVHSPALIEEDDKSTSEAGQTREINGRFVRMDAVAATSTTTADSSARSTGAWLAEIARRAIEFLIVHSRPISWALIVCVFALAAVIGLSTGNELRYIDEEIYDRAANSFLSGDGLVDSQGRPTAYPPPGFPWYLATIYRVWPQPLAAKLINAVAFAATAWMLSILAGRIVPGGRVFAPLLMLLYPVGFYTASTLYPQTWGTLLFVATLLLIDEGNRHLAATAVAGALFGLLVLAIPAFLLVGPLLAVAVAIPDRRRLVRAFAHVALFSLFAGLVVAPWTIRNARAFGRFVPVATNSGVNLLLGNSENAGPNTGVNADISKYIEQVEGLGEFEADAALQQFAIEWIVQNPGAAARLYALKVLNYFNFRNQLATDTESSSLKDAVMFFTYYSLLGLALVRLAAVRVYPMSAREAVFFAIYFANACLSAIFFTRIRFRVPFDALLVTIDAAFLGLILASLYARFTAHTPRDAHSRAVRRPALEVSRA